MTNLASLLEDTAVRKADHEAVVCADTRLTYAEVDGLANRVANLLVSRGIEPGDKVALSCPNVPFFPILYYGILKAGATVVPLNVLLKSREVAYHLADSDARAYFCFEGTPGLPMGQAGHEGFLQTDGCEYFFVITADDSSGSPIAGVETLGQAMLAQHADFTTVETADGDTAVILYTSGTTGQAKGAELSHSNMISNALASAALFDVTEHRRDRFMCVLPLFHSFGQTVIQNCAFATGATIVMLPRFEPVAALRLILAEGVTFFAGVPTMYWGLLGALEASDIDVPRLAENLRVAVSGGAALPRQVHKDFQRHFGVTILEGYGLSETSPVASFSVYGEPVRTGSIGLPIPGVQMKLIDSDWSDAPTGAVGEIAIKGPNVMKGYYHRPEATAQVMRDGWFRTGDLARVDSDGWYYIVDRSKDLIIRGGYNVYPREVEETLVRHPDVSLAAVIGVPHQSLGQEVKAVVIRTPGSTLSEETLRTWAKEQLAAYKYPRVVEFRDALPMTATGKILKRELGPSQGGATVNQPSSVLIDIIEGVAILTLNRPERKNAWTVDMQSRYFSALEQLSADPEVRVIVLTGAGGSFCPGADTQALTVYAETGTINPLTAEIAQPEWLPATLPKPMIAAIDGPCAGVGLAHALMCDIRIAAADARFSTAFVRRGLPAMHGTTWLLERVAGASVAHDLLLTGRKFSGLEARRLGVVSELAEGCTPLERALEIAHDMARNCSPQSMAQIRTQLWTNRDRSLAETIEEVDAINDDFLASADFAEGLSSFLERREPSFAGLTAATSTHSKGTS